MPRRRWVVAAAENAARHLSGEDEVDTRGAVAMAAKAADLRQEVGGRPIVGKLDFRPGARPVVPGENAGGAGQIPRRGEKQRDWARERPAGLVRRENRLRQRADGEVAPAPIGEPFLERMVD